MRLALFFVIVLSVVLSGCSNSKTQRDASPVRDYPADYESTAASLASTDDFSGNYKNATWDKNRRGEKRVSRLIDWVEISKN